MASIITSTASGYSLYIEIDDGTGSPYFSGTLTEAATVVIPQTDTVDSTAYRNRVAIVRKGPHYTGLTLTAQTVDSDGDIVDTFTSVEETTQEGVYKVSYYVEDDFYGYLEVLDGSTVIWTGEVNRVSATQTQSDFTQLDTRLSSIQSAMESVASDVWNEPTRTLTYGDPLIVPVQQFGDRVIIRGDSYGDGAKSFNVTMASGSEWPTDLSECTITFSAKKHPDNDETGDDITGTVSVTEATGSDRAVSVTLTAEDTASMAIGDYYYDIQATDADDKVWTIEMGQLKVLRDATV